MARNITPAYPALAIEHEIAAFHAANYVDDGYGAMTMYAVNIGEQPLPRISRNRVPELGCRLGKLWESNYCHWEERVKLRANV